MRKIFLCILLSLSPLYTQAFLGDGLGLNLYKEIDAGINAYEQDTYIYEVVGEK